MLCRKRDDDMTRVASSPATSTQSPLPANWTIGPPCNPATVERVVALLCNPSAGGGRAARVLPEVEGALRELDVSFHTEVTHGGGMLLAPGAGLDDGLVAPR